MNVHEEDIVEISRKLTKMTDGSKSMDDAVELVTALENMRVNIDLLSKTRIGTVLNDFRRKIKDEKVAKRCKALIKLREKDVLRFGFSSREYVLLHEHSATVGADDEAEEDTSADEGEEEDEVMDGLVDRTGGEERIAAAEEDDLF